MDIIAIPVILGLGLFVFLLIIRKKSLMTSQGDMESSKRISAGIEINIKDKLKKPLALIAAVSLAVWFWVTFLESNR